MNSENINYFAITDMRGKHTAFGIKSDDRLRHMYIIGKTGMGKSTLLENMAIQDIQNGEGLCFIDPHGSTAELLLDFVPQSRIKDVIYFAPFDSDYPIGFNIMEDMGFDKRHLVVSGIMSSFKRIWEDVWSARMEYILQNTLLALLEYPDSTLMDVNRMLSDKEFRNKVLDRVKDVNVLEYWKKEMSSYTDRFWAEAIPAIQNKIGQFISNPLIRNIIAQPKSAFDFREVMDSKKILIINLSKGRLGEQNADLLGSMLVTKIYLTAMSRADFGVDALQSVNPFYLYVDEFQSVTNDYFADILSEARKYKLALILSHQYIEQMNENVRNAVFGNVGTIVSFRVGPFDAQVLETIFKPTFFVDDIVNLGFAQIYLTLMIDGVGSSPFSALTIEPVEAPSVSFAKDIIIYSRHKYARPKAEIDDLVNNMGLTPARMGKKARKKLLREKMQTQQDKSYDASNSDIQTKKGGDYSNNAVITSGGKIKKTNMKNDISPVKKESAGTMNTSVSYAHDSTLPEMPESELRAILGI